MKNKSRLPLGFICFLLSSVCMASPKEWQQHLGCFQTLKVNGIDVPTDTWQSEIYYSEKSETLKDRGKPVPVIIFRIGYDVDLAFQFEIPFTYGQLSNSGSVFDIDVLIPISANEDTDYWLDNSIYEFTGLATEQLAVAARQFWRSRDQLIKSFDINLKRVPCGYNRHQVISATF